MKKLFLILIAVFLFTSIPKANTTKITSGQIFISGTAYNTANYQSYLAFDFEGIRQNPRIKYQFFGQQNFSVYQNHPVNPDGPYKFSVKMPYTPDGIFINEELRSPVWYSDCIWDIESSIETPLVSKGSPKFINVQAPFSMKGRMTIYGAASIATKIRGFGTSDLRFEKFDDRYFLFEARYFFGDVSKTFRLQKNKVLLFDKKSNNNTFRIE